MSPLNRLLTVIALALAGLALTPALGQAQYGHGQHYSPGWGYNRPPPPPPHWHRPQPPPFYYAPPPAYYAPPRGYYAAPPGYYAPPPPPPRYYRPHHWDRHW